MERRTFLRRASFAGLAATSFAGAAGGPARSQSDAPASSGEGAADAIPMPDGAGGDLQFSREEYDRRYAGIRAQMEARELDAVIVTGTREWHDGDLGNLRYIGAPIDWALTYCIVPIDSDPVVFRRMMNFPVVRQKMGDGPPPLDLTTDTIVPFQVEYSPGFENARFMSDHGAAIAKKLTDMGLGAGRIGVVSMRNFPADMMATIREAMPEASFEDAQPIFMSMRYVKSAEEINFMKRSGYIADVGLAALTAAVRDGAHDLDLYYAADKACAMAGGPAGGFQLVGSGPWGHEASNVVLQPGSGRVMTAGDMVIPEIASNYKGYYTQLTAPISIGDPPDEFYEAMELNQTVYDWVNENFRPGKTVWEIDNACNEYTQEVTSGEYGTLFGIQAGEHELTFWHDNYELQPGALAYNQPFFLPLTKPGGPFHVFGDAIVMTEGEPIKLHQSKMELTIV